MSAMTATVAGLPDRKVSARQVFGIDTDMQVKIRASGTTATAMASVQATLSPAR